jgi:hypothetical protein
MTELGYTYISYLVYLHSTSSILLTLSHLIILTILK